jgi:chromosome partitioning protein
MTLQSSGVMFHVKKHPTFRCESNDNHMDMLCGRLQCGVTQSIVELLPILIPREMSVVGDQMSVLVSQVPIPALEGTYVSTDSSVQHSQLSTGPGERAVRVEEILRSLPEVDESTPLAVQLAEDTRRRVSLQGLQFPQPDRTRIITVANQKGGVGKTTSTVNLAAALAQGGLSVLVIDSDPQGNASTALGVDHRAGIPSVYDVLVNEEPLSYAITQCPDLENLLVVPATIDLSGAEIELVSLVSRETRLRRAVDEYVLEREQAGLPRLDYILVDCPPSLGLLTLNAFVTGREVLIPIQCEYYALEGLSQLLKTITMIQQHLNPELHVSTILLTMFDARTNLAQQVAQEVRDHFGEQTLETTIPRSVRISEAPSYGQSVVTYEPTSTGALAYRQAAYELAVRN